MARKTRPPVPLQVALQVALTPGCPAGIGPEVIAAGVLRARVPASTRLRFMASPALLLEGARRARVEARRDGDRVLLHDGKTSRAVVCAIADEDDAGRNAAPGVVDDAALRCQRDALVRACQAAARGEVDAIVTGPVRKKALVIHGESFPGQTEVVHRFLALDDEPPLMVFAGAPFLLGLLTVHVALAEVPALITAASLERGVRRLREATQGILGEQDPCVLVLGVNPHAGENGLFGTEEERIVTPTLARLRGQGINVAGPIPADGFFADVARWRRRGAPAAKAPVHAVLAMHHDQGLAPYKLLVGGEGINVTWGLRVPRTSPDHGTADALAGHGVADPSSTAAALRLAVSLARVAAARKHPPSNVTC